MKRKFLEELLRTNANLYSAHLKSSEDNAVEKKWGSGEGEPFSVEPYRMEILGIPPGKFLDKPPKKITKNKYCYLFDISGKVISRTEYAEQTGNQWIVYREFYEYKANAVIRYSYGSAVDGQKEVPTLQKVALIEMGENDQVIAVNELLLKRLEYTETRYEYSNGVVSKISTYWPDSGVARSILVTIEGHQAYLHEITENGLEQIYPE